MKRILTPVLVFLIAFSIYVYNLAPSITANGDAGELISAAYFLGIPHPPGYPVFVLLGHLFSLLPFGQVAFRLNLMSAVLQSLTVVVVYLTMLRLVNNRFVAGVSAFALAFSYNFFYSALVTEVFPLNDLIAALIVYLLIRLSLQDGVKIKEMAALGLLFGLGLANHQTIVLLLPAAALSIWLQVKKKFAKEDYLGLGNRLVVFLGALFVGLLPYLFLLWRGRTATNPVMFSYPKNFSDLLAIATRSIYGSYSPLRGYDPAADTLVHKFGQISNYFSFLIDDFLIIGLLLMVIGIVWGLVKQRRQTLILLFAFICTGPLFLLYANFPFWMNFTLLEIVERFYLLPTMMLSFLLGLGLTAIWQFCRGKLALRFLVYPLLGSYLIYLAILNAGSVSQKGNFMVRDFARDILSEAKPGAIVSIGSDVPVYTAMYLRYVEGFRPDTEILTAYTIGDNYKYLRHARRDLNFGTDKPASVSGAIFLNLDMAPYQSLGEAPFPVPNSVSSPSGLLKTYYLYGENPKFSEWKSGALKNAAKYRSRILEYRRKTKNPSLSDLAVLSFYDSAFMDVAKTCETNGDWECAAMMYEDALIAEPDSITLYLGYADVFSKWQKCDKAKMQYETVLALQPESKNIVNSGLAALYENCYKDPKSAEVYRRKVGSAPPSSSILEKL